MTTVAEDDAVTVTMSDEELGETTLRTVYSARLAQGRPNRESSLVSYFYFLACTSRIPVAHVLIHSCVTPLHSSTLLYFESGQFMHRH